MRRCRNRCRQSPYNSAARTATPKTNATATIAPTVCSDGPPWAPATCVEIGILVLLTVDEPGLAQAGICEDDLTPVGPAAERNVRVAVMPYLGLVCRSAQPVALTARDGPRSSPHAQMPDRSSSIACAGGRPGHGRPPARVSSDAAGECCRGGAHAAGVLELQEQAVAASGLERGGKPDRCAAVLGGGFERVDVQIREVVFA